MDLRFGNFTHVSVISCGCICDTSQALHSSDKIRHQLCRSDSPTKITGVFLYCLLFQPFLCIIFVGRDKHFLKKKSLFIFCYFVYCFVALHWTFYGAFDILCLTDNSGDRLIG